MKALVLFISIFILSQNSYSQNTCMNIESTLQVCPDQVSNANILPSIPPPPPNPYKFYDVNILDPKTFTMTSTTLQTLYVYGPFSILNNDYSQICNGIINGTINPSVYTPVLTNPIVVNLTAGYYILKYALPTSSYTFALKGSCDLQNEIDFPPLNCANCITSFSPESGKYIVSAWVKEDDAAVGTVNYTNSKITVSYNGTSITSEDVFPSGQIIDGWQRMEGEIEIPVGTTDITITLTNLQSGGISFFDDIRFFPFDGSMMSYVYDPETLRLVAELDERNYAKFYEYDEEGKLIRVKKETERGVMTIQENRNNIKK